MILVLLLAVEPCSGVHLVPEVFATVVGDKKTMHFWRAIRQECGFVWYAHCTQMAHAQ